MPGVENSPAHVVMQDPTRSLYVAGRGATFITPQGDPIVPASVEQELARRGYPVKIEWVRAAWGAGHFAAKQKWRENDPRWARVQSGEIPEEQAFDVAHMFPRECPTSEFVSYIENNWGNRIDPRKEADRLIAEAMRLRAQADAEQVDGVVEHGIRRAQDDTDHQRLLRVEGTHERAHPMVHGADFEPKRLIEVAPK